MKYLVTIAFLFLTACTVSQPHIVEYRIKPPLPTKSYDATECKEKSIKVSQAFSANSLMVKKMKYTSEGFKEYSFNESEWSQSPNRAITQEIVRSIRASKLFRSVQSYKSRSESELILESTIEDFSQYFNEKEKHSYVKVLLSMSLLDAKTGRVLGMKQFSKKLQSETLDAQGGVKALNRALADTLIQSNVWLNKVCR